MEERTIETKYNYKSYIDKETDCCYDVFNRKDIIKFTYEDYLECLKEKEWKQVFQVREKHAEYTVMSSNTNSEISAKRYLY